MKLADEYISGFSALFPSIADEEPWLIPAFIPELLTELIAEQLEGYRIADGIAIHESATVEDGAVLKGPVVIGKNCFVGAHAYLRGGVYLVENTRVGPGCEIKCSLIGRNSSVAHFNFVGDSLIGNQVNMEAGAVIANHYNERTDKRIFVLVNGTSIDAKREKLGAVVGDDARIGANAVLSPGTLLLPHSVVGRLELVEQNPA